MDGYVRVSQVAGREGERFQSPAAQREAIEGWAQAHGVRIGAWHEDLDRSGGTMDRPGMNAAIARIEQGRSDGLVVARLDRFARTVIGGLTTIAQLHDRGARVVSVAESLDPATPVGRAMLGLLLIMAEWQRDVAIEHLAVAQQRATSAGRFPGRPPYGYAKTPDGLTVVNDQTAAVVRRIVGARGAGTGWRAIADELTRDRVLTPGGRERWAPSTVQGIVHSEASLGVFVGPRGLRVEDAWPAIVDRREWERANAVTGARDSERRHHDRLFAGIARCAHCRHVLSRTVNPEGFVSYGCVTVGCQERASIGARLLDEHVAAAVDARLASYPQVGASLEDAEGDLRAAEVARDAAVRELEAWRDDLELRDALGETDWREGMLARARGRDEREAALAALRAQRGVPDLAGLPDGLTIAVASLGRDLAREVAEALVHAVFVRRSRLRGPRARQHVAERVLVVFRDDPARPALPSRTGSRVLEPVRWSVPTRTEGRGRAGGAG